MNLDNKYVEELRVLSAEMITNANSGHTGIALGSAPILYSLYANIMAINPNEPMHFNRDRFVLSAGHGSSILYATLYAMGYNLTVDDLNCFRKLGSKTPGHPEFGVTDGVDCSTGPLGQGVANAVGMAISAKHLMAKFNKPNCTVINNKIYCLCGDGCLMEGVSYEALSLAGNLCLDNFVLIYDCNNITIEGSTSITFSEDIKLRFKSMGFNVFQVKDGNNVDSITKALQKSQKSKKPTVIICHTTIGHGSEFAGKEKIHGMPLKQESLQKLKLSLSVIKPDMDLSVEAKQHFGQKSMLAKQRLEDRNNLQVYKKLYPKEYKQLVALISPKDYSKEVEKVKKLKTKTLEMRDINQEVLSSISEILTNMFGGSADVGPSTKSIVKDATAFSCQNYGGDLIHYGVREHAMCAISNGIALYGLEIPYQSCYLSFYDYLKPALRMGAIMNLRQLLVCTHDSILTGQDGPTHQPIEQLPSLRATPNLIVSRPYNATETIASYVWFLQYQNPTVILTSKDTPTIRETELEKALMGGYVVDNHRGAEITLVATGADVSLALNVSEILANKKIPVRVVSMPCVSVFESQKNAYKKQVLKDHPKVFVESSAETYWYKLAEKEDLVLSLNNFGASGSPAQVQKHMQFDAETLANRIIEWFENLKK